MRSYELDGMSDEEMLAVLERADVDLTEASRIARKIISKVRRLGDKALLECARKYDGLSSGQLVVPAEEAEAAFERLPTSLAKALATSKERIERFHSRQKLPSFEFRDSCGEFGQKVVPLGRIGAYVPGGSASYASSVLMTCVPARVAGVREIALFTPGTNGVIDDNILAAAHICGVDEIYALGGAQAIAAMAYGTTAVRRVSKIVGPGGAVVSAAKLLVRNDCEIDMLAGPSEVLILADSGADPGLTAAEMLAQLEHDRFARALLVTTSKKLIERTREMLSTLLESADRRAIASSAAENGAVFIRCKSLVAGMEFSNRYAPEHLLIDVADPRMLLDRVESAGSVFVGRQSSVAFGDYCSGPNHVLPTKGRASMRSGLSTYDFVKVISYQSISSSGARRLAPVASEIAVSEGLPAHALSAVSRARGTIR